MSPLLAFEGVMPRLGREVFVAANATVIGRVTLGDEASVWFGCVLRGDVGSITIGARTNVQDLTMIHMTGGVSASPTHTVVGDDVTIGHGAILHGCEVGHRCLIGMGSILLDNVRIGEESVVGAGSVVRSGTIVPPRTLVVGNPARVLRPVNERELGLGLEGARHYVEHAKKYR